MAKLHNLQLHKLLNGKWVHHSTVIWNAPYSLCKGEKIKKEAYKSHFEYYKIVPNEIKTIINKPDTGKPA